MILFGSSEGLICLICYFENQLMAYMASARDSCKNLLVKTLEDITFSFISSDNNTKYHMSLLENLRLIFSL